MKYCQHPVDDPELEECSRPADVYTDDLQEIHYLCREHFWEAERFNDFHVEPVES